LKGKIIKANVEDLNISENKFDIVYSYGVLHHTPDIKKAMLEIRKVMRNTGDLIIMLYCKESFNYWFRIHFYFRFRLIFEWIKKKIGLKSKELWNKHLLNLEKTGWGYISWKEFPHHCTDGPECKIANIYSKREIRILLADSGFKVNKIVKAHFPIGGRFPSLERKIARLIGFHRIIWAKKKEK
jgi:SAM-dependent methyltransferase